MLERNADQEEYGKLPKNIESELVIEVLREKNNKREPLTELNKPVRKGDVLISLACGIASNYIELRELGEMAKELDVKLSVHTPYYMDLVTNEEICYRSMDAIRWAAIIANELKAEIVTTHLGLYGDVTPKTAQKRMRERMESLSKWISKNKMKVKIGAENSGRQEVFGSISEIISLSKNIKGVVPVINFARAHAREGGTLREPEDFQKLVDKLLPFSSDKRIYSHFSGVEHEDGNEKRLTPIKKGDLRFEPLADCVLDGGYEMTFISSSPLLEHDAMYMKVIFERLLAKRLAKEQRVNKKGG